jgi:hypothetical protein
MRRSVASAVRPLQPHRRPARIVAPSWNPARSFAVNAARRSKPAAVAWAGRSGAPRVAVWSRAPEAWRRRQSWVAAVRRAPAEPRDRAPEAWVRQRPVVVLKPVAREAPSRLRRAALVAQAGAPARRRAVPSHQQQAAARVAPQGAQNRQLRAVARVAPQGAQNRQLRAVARVAPQGAQNRQLRAAARAVPRAVRNRLLPAAARVAPRGARSHQRRAAARVARRVERSRQRLVAVRAVPQVAQAHPQPEAARVAPPGVVREVAVGRRALEPARAGPAAARAGQLAVRQLQAAGQVAPPEAVLPRAVRQLQRAVLLPVQRARRAVLPAQSVVDRGVR